MICGMAGWRIFSDLSGGGTCSKHQTPEIGREAPEPCVNRRYSPQKLSLTTTHELKWSAAAMKGWCISQTSNAAMAIAVPCTT